MEEGDSMPIIADPWLLDLGVRGGNYRIVAARLLRCQVRTYNLTGHIMDLCSVSVRATITWYAGYGKIGFNVVRCSRCDAKAMLPAWVNADKPEMREGLADQWKEANSVQRDAMAFRAPCSGDTLARGMADILRPALKEKPSLPVDIAQIAREVVELTEE